jgi:hypothetical protein
MPLLSAAAGRTADATAASATNAIIERRNICPPSLHYAPS